MLSDSADQSVAFILVFADQSILQAEIKSFYEIQINYLPVDFVPCLSIQERTESIHQIYQMRSSFYECMNASRTLPNDAFLSRQLHALFPRGELFFKTDN